MKKFLLYILLGVFLLALSTRTYSSWRRGFDYDPVQHPWTIVAGDSLAPHQYRILYPAMWWGLSRLMPGELADKALLFLTIVGCYTVLFGVFRSLMKSIPLACLGLLAFLGTCMHPYQFQFRDTFLEIGLVALAFYLQIKTAEDAKIWNWLAAISFLGTLNRETWIFVLSGCLLAQCSRGIRVLWTTAEGRTALTGLAKMILATAMAVVTTRGLFGFRPLYCRLWTWHENLAHILFWTNLPLTVGHGIWGIGAGVFIVYLLTLLDGSRHQWRFVAGYLAPLFVVSFLTVARWIESRTFFPAFAVVIATIGMHISQKLSARETTVHAP